MDESQSFRSPAADSRRAGKRWLVAFAALALLLLAAITWWFVQDRGGNVDLGALLETRRADPALASDPAPKPSAAPAGLARAQDAAPPVKQVAQQQGGLDARVAAMEQRLTRLDLQAQAAAGNAVRAEGLLIAFATRRALERGAPLGYLEDQLRLRFADSQPNAVRAVMAAARDPVTLEQLLAGLDALAPALAEPAGEESLLTRIGREFSAAFVVRRENTPSPAAQQRLERARLFLQTGRADDALTEVRNLPNSAAAQEWIVDAERYADGQSALELIETAAVLTASELRDGAGAPIPGLAATP